MKNQILKYILEKNISNNVQNGSVNTDGSGISYHLSYDFDFFNNIAKLNNKQRTDNCIAFCETIRNGGFGSTDERPEILGRSARPFLDKWFMLHDRSS